MLLPTLEDVLACPGLPSLPAVAIEVLELTRDQDVQLAEIARVVQNDPALTAKILKTVNSSFYGLSKPCPTIDRALAFLGLSTVKSLVLGFSLVDMTRWSKDGFDMESHWRRCLLSSAAAREMAGRLNSCDPEEAFVAGLMQDVGMLAISAVAPSAYGKIIARTSGDHRRLTEEERDELGFDHAEAGARLGESWRLPEEIVDAIRYHHFPQKAKSVDLVRTVALSCEAATVIELPNPAKARGQLDQHSEEWFRYSAAELDECLQEIVTQAKELGRLFNVSTGEMPDVNHILSEAQDASMQHQLTIQREQENLRKSNEELARQATTDGLTNIANRKRFDEEMAERFAQARAFNGTVGMILADADKFKNLNDTYGHLAGDAVLVELARRLGEAVRGVDLVCRYGGEEFGIVLPGASLVDVATIAERLRLTVVDELFDMTGVPGVDEPLPVSISLGAAVFSSETAHLITSPEILIKAADKALYAAKEAGRNCVRVFSLTRKRADAA